MSALSHFIGRWHVPSGPSAIDARGFITELCATLERPLPESARHSDPNRVTLYRPHCFVLECTQPGAGASVSTSLPGPEAPPLKRGTPAWEAMMQRARRRAERTARALPTHVARPPFLIVVDSGYCIDLYADFSRSGGMYLPYSGVPGHRLFVHDLDTPETLDMLRALWDDPASLDESARATRATLEAATHLETLARLLEADGHESEQIFPFLMRWVISLTAEATGIIPAGSVSTIVDRAATRPETCAPELETLWAAMIEGTSHPAENGHKLPVFGGGMFADACVLPLGPAHIACLARITAADWRHTDPALLGPMVDHMLKPKARRANTHGYPSLAVFERLVLPALVRPLDEEWQNVQTAATLMAESGKSKDAIKLYETFLKRLGGLRVLDPACGPGSVLCVALAHVKRLEGEVLQHMATFGVGRGLPMTARVNPRQFLGLDINPRSARIAEVMLWLSWLRGHVQIYGAARPLEVLFREYDNIQCRDALLTWGSWRYATDREGRYLSRWDGETFTTDPHTGISTPDESMVIVDKVYDDVKTAPWPKADVILSCPPLTAGASKRKNQGDGYMAALGKIYKELPASCDAAMYWWNRAAALVREGKALRFGFVMPESIDQTANRRIVALHLADKKPLHLAYVLPNHPWRVIPDALRPGVPDATGPTALAGDSARVTMIVGARGKGSGVLALPIGEQADGLPTLRESLGEILADLRQGVDVSTLMPLMANAGLCHRGVSLHGAGFILSPEQASEFGYDRNPALHSIIRPYCGAKDINSRPSGSFVLDLDGLSEDDIRNDWPDIYQWLYVYVKPEREQNRVRYRRENWWLFGGKHTGLRGALADLPRAIATVETAAQRVFVFLPGRTLPDSKLISIASDDAWHLGVLSSRAHVRWALAAGELGVGNDSVYIKSLCFAPFPFPDADEAQRARVRDLGERLDAHRRQRQAMHPELTMTAMYNALDALREERPLTAREKAVIEQGDVGTLLALHDALDAAVVEAYGWPTHITDADMLTRLVALHATRAEEEDAGHIRWLREDYQARSLEHRVDTGPTRTTRRPKHTVKELKASWPSGLLEQVQAIRGVVNGLPGADVNTLMAELLRRFARGKKLRMREVLQAMLTLGLLPAEAAAQP